MKNYERKILQYLNNHSQATAASLSRYLGVSIRTVKNYVRQLNTSYSNIILSSNKGYALNPDFHFDILSEVDTPPIPQTSRERGNYMINQLINSPDNTPVNIYDLCDDMFISLSTCKAELQKVKKRLERFHLSLLIKGDFISAEGTERDKRKILSSVFYDGTLSNFINYDSLQNAFLNIDINLIKRIILDKFRLFHYFINDYSLINLVLHVTITIDRIRNNNISFQICANPSKIPLRDYSLAREIARQLETDFDISFAENEIYELALLISSRATSINYKNITLSNLETFVGEPCIKLVRLLLENIRTYYFIDISEPDFIIRFALHIHNLLIRSENNYLSKNPLCKSIKATCPFIYDVSVSAAQIIKEEADVLINDDEIAYIAFHLGSTLEEQKNLISKLSAVLYCPSYYDMNLKIVERINFLFSENIVLTDIVTEESNLKNLAGIDLIISVLPISGSLSIPHEIVSLTLNERDQQIIKSRISQLQHTRKKHRFEAYLRKLITPELFERKKGVFDKNECISYMTGKLEKAGYVNHTFYKEVKEREELSSTAFGPVAIPHSMRMQAFQTGIHILIPDPPVIWDDNNTVQLILMMCFSKNDRHIFNEIFEPITMILTDTSNIKKLVSCTTYEEFIKSFVSLF